MKKSKNKKDCCLHCGKEITNAWLRGCCSDKCMDEYLLQQRLTKKQYECGMCDSNHRKIAVTQNGIKVCYDCLVFVENRSKDANRSPFKQLEIDTKYIALNA